MEFIRILKGGFKDGFFEKKLYCVREVNILMFDDIGVEEVILWVRDEVIGFLLYYWMVYELLIFFSFNFDYSELEYYLVMICDGEEKIKVVCIIECVKFLLILYFLLGENFRNNWILKWLVYNEYKFKLFKWLKIRWSN